MPIVTFVFGGEDLVDTRVVDVIPHLNEVVIFTRDNKTIRGSVESIAHHLDEENGTKVHLRLY